MENQPEAFDKIAPAFIKAQGAMKNVAKDSVNPFFNSHYADLTAVWDMCRGPLQENGLGVTQTLKVGEHGTVMLTILMHVSGQRIIGEYPIRPAKDDPQGMGSAVTYAKRYALCAMLGIVADEDDDANTASGVKPAARQTQTATAKAPAPVQAAQPAAPVAAQPATPPAANPPAGNGGGKPKFVIKDPGAPATDSQRAALNKIVERKRIDADKALAERGWTIEGLTKGQASDLIDGWQQLPDFTAQA